MYRTGIDKIDKVGGVDSLKDECERVVELVKAGAVRLDKLKALLLSLERKAVVACDGVDGAALALQRENVVA